jgi:hypothetical protein
MSQFETIVVVGAFTLLALSACGHPPELIPEGIYGHPADKDDQHQIPDNATPIDLIKESGQSRRS